MTKQCAWLIEVHHNGGNFRWLKHFTSAGGVDWTYDASEAVRFVRETDAEAVRPVVQVFCPAHWNVQVSEHMWPAVEPKAPQCPVGDHCACQNESKGDVCT